MWMVWCISLSVMTHSSAWQTLTLVCVTWHIHVCGIKDFYHVSFHSSTGVTWLILMPRRVHKQVVSQAAWLIQCTLQHTAIHCNTLQHTATHCNTLQHTATHCNTLQHTATRCNTLQHSYSLTCKQVVSQVNKWCHTNESCHTRSQTSGVTRMSHVTHVPKQVVSPVPHTVALLVPCETRHVHIRVKWLSWQLSGMSLVFRNLWGFCWYFF